jgi:hypothetical protein
MHACEVHAHLPPQRSRQTLLPLQRQHACRQRHRWRTCASAAKQQTAQPSSGNGSASAGDLEMPHGSGSNIQAGPPFAECSSSLRGLNCRQATLRRAALVGGSCRRCLSLMLRPCALDALLFDVNDEQRHFLPRIAKLQSSWWLRRTPARCGGPRRRCSRRRSSGALKRALRSSATDSRPAGPGNPLLSRRRLTKAPGEDVDVCRQSMLYCHLDASEALCGALHAVPRPARRGCRYCAAAVR